MARQIDDFAASAARTATGQGSAIKLGPHADNVAVLLNVTAVSGTSPSCTFTIEWSNDGTTFAQADTADTFTAITAVSNKVKSFPVKGVYARLVWTITGTTPSFTFAATATASGAGRAFA